jgi:hypothetical protein
MDIYPKGHCPICKKEIQPTSNDVFEKNRFRRDVIRCPSCKSKILRCMAPGCNNYAEGGDTWDDNICPSCKSPSTFLVYMESMVKIGSVIVTSVLAVLRYRNNRQ